MIDPILLKWAMIEHRRIADADRLKEPCTPWCAQRIADQYARFVRGELSIPLPEQHQAVKS